MGLLQSASRLLRAPRLSLDHHFLHRSPRKSSSSGNKPTQSPCSKTAPGSLTAFHSPNYDLERASGSAYLLLSNTLLTPTSKPANIKEHWPQFCLYKITNSSGSSCLHSVIYTQKNLPLESWQFMSSFFIYWAIQKDLPITLPSSMGFYCVSLALSTPSPN